MVDFAVEEFAVLKVVVEEFAVVEVVIMTEHSN